MSASTKLSNSVKALLYLAGQNKPQSSTTISQHTGVNASKIRKLLSELSKIGIVQAMQGSSGGFILARSPDKIHLQEVYCGIEDRKAFHLDVAKQEHSKQNRTAMINDYFLALFAEIQVEIEDKMRGITLEHIISKTS